MTEKLGRHKLLLKKRKSQPGRSSAESSGSQEVENITSGEGSVVSSATGGSNGKLQSIRMRGGLSSEAGVKRLERLPVVSRSPSGLTSAPGRIPSGLNRFAELLKNRKGGDSGSRESGESKERKTDVGNLFETPRRPVPGNSGLDLIVSNYMYCIYWQGTLSPHMETRRYMSYTDICIWFEQLYFVIKETASDLKCCSSGFSIYFLSQICAHSFI